jgi:alkyl sulfatase BDS1-like metallo-beta-lactamase superfamily hydrolase
MTATPKDATPTIRDQHAALLETLPFDDEADFEAADRGFIGALEPGVVHGLLREIRHELP